jgi:hypothetical protein
MTMNSYNHLTFLQAACDMLGFGWPSAALTAEHEAGVLLRFELVTGVVISISHVADVPYDLVSWEFDQPLARTNAEVAQLALKANHLRQPEGWCFSVDPKTDRLTASVTIQRQAGPPGPGDRALVDFCERVATFTTLAVDWRRMMDRPRSSREALNLTWA